MRAFAVTGFALAPISIADNQSGANGQHWVASWATSPATSFVYVPPVAPAPPGPPTTFAPANIQPDLIYAFPEANTTGATDQTFRSIVKPDLWGNTMRVRFSNVFGGDAGLTVPSISTPDALGALAPEVWFAWIGVVPAVITFVVLANLVSTRYGRDFRAIREDEIAAQLHGIRIARKQVIAFVLSGACAGLAGCLMAYTANVASPGGFPLTLSLELLAAIVIGGIGRLPGAIWGAVIIVLAPDVISSFNDALHLPGGVRAQLPLALCGAVLIVAMLGFPHGIQGALDRLWLRRARVRAAR